MDLLLLVLIVGIVVWLARRGEKASRVDRLEGELVALQGRVRELQAEVTLLLEKREASPAIARPEAAPPPRAAMAQVAPPIAAAAEAEPWARRPAEMPPIVEAAPELGVPRRIVKGKRMVREAASRAVAAFEAEPEPAGSFAVAPEPAGPGLIERALAKLGLAPSAEGELPSRAAIEAWLEGRMLAVVGGIALLLGAVFFLSLAFSRGWITEPMRVLIGLGAGVGLLVLGELAFSKLRGILGHVLVAVGLATVSLALLAATRLYDLVPVEWGLAGAFVAAVAAAAIAIRHDSQLVAAFGLIAVLAAPPVLGASPTLVTLLFVAVTLVGTTGVALFRTWIWLPPLAFVLAGPQLASYVLGDAPVVEALIAIAGFWLVNTIAAGGEEARHATDRLRTTTVTLLLANAAFTIWAGFTVLGGPEEIWRGTFLAVMAAAHLALGLFFLVRNGDRHPFGLVVAATGVAALTMAVPVQFGGPPVPIAWAAEAVALAWVAVMRRHPYSAAVSMLLGVLALGHLVAIEYKPTELVAGFSRRHPVRRTGGNDLRVHARRAGRGCRRRPCRLGARRPRRRRRARRPVRLPVRAVRHGARRRMGHPRRCGGRSVRTGRRAADPARLRGDAHWRARAAGVHRRTYRRSCRVHEPGGPAGRRRGRRDRRHRRPRPSRVAGLSR